MALAAYVAATRIVDYKHRPADVLAGAAVGAAFAAGCRPRGLAQWWSVLTREERPEASAEEMAAMRREEDAHWERRRRVRRSRSSLAPHGSRD